MKTEDDSERGQIEANKYNETNKSKAWLWATDDEV